MATFRDGNGREWHVAITVAVIKRVQELTGVHLTQLVDDQLKPLAELVSDPVRLVDVVFAICKPQADAAGITDQQFGESLTGDAVESMQRAFVSGLMDFFPKRQRDLMNQLMARMDRLQDALALKQREKMDEVTDEQLISSVLSSLGL